ncbi:hypothetical protein [Legionella saoudiensis]|uniref:hypothetical protein n=1 Tax=Legionella saoudiensis TaxID=1750561 RepID=UPI0007305EFC|nr:hypothetical protein [Legionella saoudiensis]
MKFAWITFLFLMGISNAYAYLDPGSGSLIIQTAIASIAGFFYVFKTFIGNLKNKYFPKAKDEQVSFDEPE